MVLRRTKSSRSKAGLFLTIMIYYILVIHTFIDVIAFQMCAFGCACMLLFPLNNILPQSLEHATYSCVWLKQPRKS